MAIRQSRSGFWIATLTGAVLVTGMLVWFYYPVVPRSFLGWSLLFLLGIPTWIAIEWLGSAVLSAKVFSRLSSAGRIALGVPVLIALAAVAAVAIWIGQRIIVAT